ncbi:hypothetical protein Tco_0556173 [Tanacetum coccineum]
MSQPANDEFSQHLSDDEASNHEDASDTGAAPKQKQQVIPQTTAILQISNLQFLMKGGEHMRRFHGIDDAKEIWEAIRTRFQQLLSQLEAHGAEVSTEDANYKFLRSLPPAWSNLAMTMRTKPDVDTLSIDDLYNNLRGFEGNTSYLSSLTNKQSEDWDLLHEDLEQIDDLDIEEMDINWQIAMIAIRMKKFYKKTGRRVRVDGKTPGTHDGKKRRDSFYQHQEAGKQEKNQMGLLTMDDGIVNWGEHTEDEETNHALMAISSSSEGPQEPEPNVSDDRSVNCTVKTKTSCGSMNAMMERELGEGYSFTKKKCFVCGSLSHLIKDCDYYEKKMAREAEFKKQRVFNTGNGVAKPVWTNANRVNHANQFVPRSVQLNAGRPNINSVRPNINTGRTNINSVRPNINTGRVNVNSVRPNVNTGRVNVNSVKSNVNTGRTNVNPVRPRVNTGSSNVNTVRSRQPVPTKTSNSFSPKRPQVNQLNQRRHFSKSHSPVSRPIVRNTARMTYSHAVKGNCGTAVKTSAGYNWRKTRPNSNYDSRSNFVKTVNVKGPQGRPKPVKAWVPTRN